MIRACNSQDAKVEKRRGRQRPGVRDCPAQPGKAEEIHPDPSAPGPHDPTPGEAVELPDIVVSRSWAGDWMLQLQRLST
ncbi:hypothetical protein U0070_019978 [Myodes glareolus]|uniref:Uncharacterized protein n=1 Tax=Myodes glareolus TaxID=447135 RepID=A0AAW0I8M1_MYOGA